MTLPYRPNPLEYPVTSQQLVGLNDTIENIYTELRRLSSALEEVEEGGAAHDILSATHSDATVASAVDGDILIRTGGAWARLAVGTNLHFLQVVSNLPAWGVDGSLLEDLNAAELTGTIPAASILHDLLSEAHQDSVPASAVLGDTIVAQTSGGLDMLKFWLDGAAGDLIPNELTLANQQFWFDGSAGGILGTSLVTRWKRKAIGTAGMIPVSTGTDWNWQSSTVATGGNYAVSVSRTSDFTITDSTPVSVTLQSEAFDEGGFWIVTAPTKFTVPSGAAGNYIIVGQATLETTAGGGFQVSIHVNGSEKAAMSVGLAVGPDSVQPVQCVLIAQLDVADYVELVVEYRADVVGFTQDVHGGATSTFLEMVKV